MMDSQSPVPNSRRWLTYLGAATVTLAVVGVGLLSWTDIWSKITKPRRPSKKDIDQTEAVDVKQNSISKCECTNCEDVETCDGDCDQDIAIPESRFLNPSEIKICVKTFGCSHNMTDSETMSGLLKAAGYVLTDSLEECQLAVLNSCTVKNPSQDALVNQIKKLQAARKCVIATGCVPQGDRTLEIFKDTSLVGVTQYHMIVEAVEQTLQGNRVEFFSSGGLPTLDLPKVRRNRYVEIIALSSGCLGACTYCKTKHARGQLISYPTAAILDRIRSCLKEGIRQIWLTSEDTGAYGLDISTNIADLLESIADSLQTVADPTVMVRVGMTNPPYMLEHIQRIANVLAGPNFFEFMHIPVQSGSNSVLTRMNREYSREDFCILCDQVKKFIPNISLATDIICGFPGETEDEHKETLSLIDRYQFPTINISQFYPRPGTSAAYMQRVPTSIVKKRSGEVTRLFHSYSTHEKWIGDTLRVWFSCRSDRSEHTVGHTKQYIKVLVPLDNDLIGTCADVLVESCSKWHLMGTVLKH